MEGPDQVCRGCRSSHLIQDYSAGDLVCEDCGLVNAERIFQEGEDERHFENEDEDRTHVEHTNEALDDLRMTTGIHNDGTALGAGLRAAQRAVNQDDQSLFKVYAEIDRLCARVGLPNTSKVKAQDLARVYMTTALAGRRKHSKALTAAAVYITATHFQGEAMTFSELASEAQLDVSVLYKHYEKMVKYLQTTGEVPSQTRTTDFLSRYMEALNIPFLWKGVAGELYQKVRSFSSTASHKPSVLSAAVLYFLSIKTRNFNVATLASPTSASSVSSSSSVSSVTLESISRVSNVAAATIRGCVEKEFFPQEKALLPLLQLQLQPQKSSSVSQKLKKEELIPKKET